MQIPFNKITPQIHPSCFLASQSIVIGDVKIGEESSVWFQSVVRGDVNLIRIGCRTNIQDLSMVHVTNTRAPRPAPTFIGDEVTIGHKVLIHGCTIKDRCLIGMGAILMDGVVVGEDCIIGAGSLVTEGTVIESGYLAFGSPARVIRPLSEVEKTFIRLSAANYVELSKQYMQEQEI